MSMNTKKNIAIVLLVLSMLLWVLRKLNVLYIPGLSMILLALSMALVGVMMFQLKQKKKLAGTLIVAFGLLCVVVAIMEIKGSFWEYLTAHYRQPRTPIVKDDCKRETAPPSLLAFSPPSIPLTLTIL